MKQFSDLAAAALNGAINDTDGSLTLASEGAPGTFPAAGPFDVLIENELITVGARSGTSCTALTRGVGGTVAASHASGAIVRHVLTAAAVRGLRAVVKRKTATEVVNASAVYQDDDHLSFDIGANEVWAFECVLFLTGTTTGDFKVTMAVPAGATLMSGVHGLVNNVTTASGSLYAFSGAGDHQFIGAPGAAVALTIYRGIVVNGATAGTCTLQWAQQTSTGADTSVLVNSYMVAEEAQ